MQLHIQIGALMEKHGYTNQSMADASGVPVGTVSGIRSGKIQSPSFEAIVAMMRSMGDSVDALVGITSSAIAQLQPPPKSRAETLAELAPTVRNVLDAYSAAETPAEQNALLKSVISRIVYYKRDTVAPGQSPADAITLDIFPLLPPE